MYILVFVIFICQLSNIKKAVQLRIKVFHFGCNLPKKVPNHYPEHYPNKEKMHRIVIWHLFWEIGAEVKTFRRSSHLYQSALSHDTSSLLSHFYRSLALFTCHYQVTPDYDTLCFRSLSCCLAQLRASSDPSRHHSWKKKPKSINTM